MHCYREQNTEGLSQLQIQFVKKATILQKLKEIGINHTVMLTGDDTRTANAIAEDLA